VCSVVRPFAKYALFLSLYSSPFVKNWPAVANLLFCDVLFIPEELCKKVSCGVIDQKKDQPEIASNPFWETFLQNTNLDFKKLESVLYNKKIV